MAKKKPLTPRQKEILEALEGRTVEEAAKHLGLTPGSVYGHVNRIRQAGHTVVLDGRGGNGKASSLPPADLPPLRGAQVTSASTSANGSGALNGVLARIDKETDEALAQEKAALEEAKVEREKLVGQLAEVDQVIEERTTTLGVLADVSARLHDAPITS